ncbi:hypothetical protein [Oenococcus oeni]|uniref:Uncharacterized protein n=3 Tax=root TaxID=1 RepID=V9QKZ3_9CAUD|nr:hypothetical protein [Oenococcus oeni]YP_009005202.1 hypothetical protein CF77_gp09 [Oenococcus phage phi9805]AHC30356.1 hypothetical protein [Oenococcus phage phi9805]EFD87385.1 hypothetical protein AWRIB429_2088 [Oenococcus oeni AWRIB429]EJO11934.1 hypothetical protein AWRIB576_124 [Oenococcus oeni AWRIB576]EJO12024.1 hypothetical protein AWRIB568_204 [Oenococcus oeni AWRIB568]KGH60272.1 hypothetical protein X288_02190 [Oenococcus oeni IOEB_9805]
MSNLFFWFIFILIIIITVFAMTINSSNEAREWFTKRRIIAWFTAKISLCFRKIILRNLKILLFFFIALMFLFYFRFEDFRNLIDKANLISISGILAIIAIISNYLTIIEERNKMKELEAKQASKITSWISGKVTADKPDRFGNTLGNKITISNQSNSPIYDVWCFLVSNKSVDDKKEDIFDSIQIDYSSHIELIAPGNTEIEMYSPGDAMGGVHPASTIIFRDTNKRYWVRSHSGKLMKVDKMSFYAALNKKGCHSPGYPEPISIKYVE